MSRKAEHVEAAAAAIAGATARECLPLVADVRQPEAVAAAVGRVVEHFGRLDIVINGAAGNFLCPAADLSPNGFGVVLDIDAKGTWNVTKAAYAAWLVPTAARSSTSARRSIMAVRPRNCTSRRRRRPSTP